VSDVIGTAPTRSPSNTAVRHSVTVAGWTLASRATGLARIAVIGAVLGPTYFANTFVTTNFVPNVTYSAIAGPALAMVVVPATVGALVREGTGRATAMLGRVSGFLLTLAGSLTVLAMTAAPALAWMLTCGIADAAARAQARDHATVLVLLVAPQITMYAVAALGAAAQQARGRFALAAAAPAVENIGLVATVLVAGLTYGTGREVTDVPLGLLVVLGAGSSLAVACHAGLQAFGAIRAGLPIRPTLRWRSDADATEIARRLGRCFVIPACTELAFFAVLAVAATVPGGVVVLQVAYAVYSVPTALGARAISTVALPRMSAAVERDDRGQFAAACRQALSYATITSLPALCLLTFFARPIAQIMTNGELRSTAFVEQLTSCVMVIAVAQAVAGMHETGRQALFARVDLHGPRLASMRSLAVTVAVGLGAVLLEDGTARLAVCAAAILAGDLVAASTVLARLRAVVRPERFVEGRRLAVAGMAVAAMVPATATGCWLLSTGAGGPGAVLALLAGFALLALATYVVVLRAGMRPSTGRAS